MNNTFVQILLNWSVLKSLNILVRINSFFKNYIIQEEPIAHNVL